MDKGRRGVPISEIMRSPGQEKWRMLAARGASTFLMLDAGSTGGADLARPDAEGAALAATAGEIYRGLFPGDREAWPGGIALALQMLAERSFFPPVAPSAGAVREDERFRELAEGRYVRVVNFHATPRWLAGGLEEQLSRLASHFSPVSYDDLVGLMTTGEWPHDRPGVVLNFFDGYRDNYDVAAPILDRLGLTGWFFLVSGWVSASPKDQRAFAADNRLVLSLYDGLPADERLALSPGEVRDLADRGHVIASHTRTHSTTLRDLTPEALAREAGGSRRELEEISGSKVRALSWYAGVALGENAPADAALGEAGYELLFANHAVQRVR